MNWGLVFAQCLLAACTGLFTVALLVVVGPHLSAWTQQVFDVVDQSLAAGSDALSEDA